MFGHIPGLKVVMPSTAYDVKGLLMASIADDNPVLLVDERWLYEQEEHVPEEPFKVPIGEGTVRREGKDATVVAISYMVYESMQAADSLAAEGIEVEVIDLRSLKPLDEQLVFDSVKRTGRLVVADGGWKSFGAAAEIAALVSEQIFSYLKSPIKRVTLPDAPAPASGSLEKVYYPTASNISLAVKTLMNGW